MKTKPEPKRLFAEDMEKNGLLMFLPKKITVKAGIVAAVAFYTKDTKALNVQGMIKAKGQKILKGLLCRLMWALRAAQKNGTSADAQIAVGTDLRASVVPFSVSDMRPVVVVERGGLK
jgi:hypothetical protein